MIEQFDEQVIWWASYLMSKLFDEQVIWWASDLMEYCMIDWLIL